MLCWNVWSAQSSVKLSKVLDFLIDMQIDIACICETWFTSDSGAFSATIKEAGFDVKHAHRGGKLGGGVAIIFKHGLFVKKEDASTSNYSSFEYASIIIKCTHSYNILLMCIYRKQEEPVSIFLTELENLLEKSQHRADCITVVGDFNIWADVCNSQSKKLMNLMSVYGLVQQVQDPTHIAGHILDHVYCNPFQLSLQINVLSDRYDISPDHQPIIIQVPLSSSQENHPKESYFRNLKNINIDSIRDELAEVIAGFQINEYDSAVTYERLKTLTNKLLEKHAPLRKYSNSSPRHLSSPA